MPNIRSLIRRLLSNPNELEKRGRLDWDAFTRVNLLTAQAIVLGIGYSILALQTCSRAKSKISNPIENLSSPLIDPITPSPPIGPIPIPVSINRAQFEADNYRRKVAMARELNEFDNK